MAKWIIGYSTCRVTRAGLEAKGHDVWTCDLAARLGLPMLMVRPETIIDCFLGATGRNIGSLFSAAKEEGPVIMFMDEFDALAPKRQSGGRDAQAERNAAVNTLLQRIEAHEGILIAATNLAQDIDQAIWRRFDIHIELGLPGPEERRRILARYLSPYGLPAEALGEMAEGMETASPALMRQFCEAMKRNLILGPRLDWDMARAATIDRILSGLEPHKDLGRPRLWAHKSADRSVSLMPWPLPMAADVVEDVASPAPRADGNVFKLGGGK